EGGGRGTGRGRGIPTLPSYRSGRRPRLWRRQRGARGGGHRGERRFRRGGHKNAERLLASFLRRTRRGPLRVVGGEHGAGGL
ncbi:MAG: hypothetical protein AVDCRST_MAG12-3260, partial [uncultured Rubrobacteraceae bacterium]